MSFVSYVDFKLYTLCQIEFYSYLHIATKKLESVILDHFKMVL